MFTNMLHSYPTLLALYKPTLGYTNIHFYVTNLTCTPSYK